MSLLDTLEKSPLTQEDIRNLVPILKPDFHIIVNSKGSVSDFRNRQKIFEDNLFLFLDSLPYVTEYLSEIRYGEDRDHFYFGFAFSMNIISYVEFARFIRGIFAIKYQFAKSINYENDLLCVFKLGENNEYSEENSFAIRLSYKDVIFRESLKTLYYYMFGDDTTIKNYERVKDCAMCIYDSTLSPLDLKMDDFKSPLRVVRDKR